LGPFDRAVEHPGDQFAEQALVGVTGAEEIALWMPDPINKLEAALLETPSFHPAAVVKLPGPRRTKPCFFSWNACDIRFLEELELFLRE
jgi:hypothetical protein